jgi:hypothetical protein
MKDDPGVRFTSGRYRGWLVRLVPKDALDKLDPVKLPPAEREAVIKTLQWHRHRISDDEWRRL